MIYTDYKTAKPGISKLGYGLMRLPTVSEDSEAIDYERAAELIDTAMKSGVNYYDTAFGYHNEQSEVFVGDVISQYDRGSYCLTSKLPSWKISDSVTPEQLLSTQLKRCKTDYFDFYLLHSITEDSIDKYIDSKSIELLDEKKKQGVIRNKGFSYHGGLELFKRLLDEYEWDVVQLQLNYYDWTEQNAREKYEMLAERGIPCIVMEPVRGGSLHKLNTEARAVIEALPGGFSPASYALRFAGQLPGVMTVLSGMTDMSQLTDNLNTFSKPLELNAEESEALNKAAVLFRTNFAIPCTACRYCTSQCPNGIEIPEIFKAYNEYNKTRDKADFEALYSHISPENNASSCTACNSCTENCPQKIDIPKQLGRINKL